MINIKQTLTKSTIKQLNKKLIFEKYVYAMLLLEQLSTIKNEIPFVFKGGTSLLLHFNNPIRFSIDIDVNLKEIFFEQSDYLLNKLKESNKSFIECKEDKRRNKKNIKCRHYCFTYKSHITKEIDNIILDVVFQDFAFEYKNLDIKNKSLIYDNKVLSVPTITVDDLLADKLTAFAPNTIGIKYIDKNELGRPKSTEIIKQLCDLGILSTKYSNLNRVLFVYENIAKLQIKYSNLTKSIADCLVDTIKTCETIFANGKINKENWKILKTGMMNFDEYKIGEKFLYNDFVKFAINVDILACKLLCKLKKVSQISEIDYYFQRLMISKNEFKLLFDKDEDYDFFKSCCLIDI